MIIVFFSSFTRAITFNLRGCFSEGIETKITTCNKIAISFFTMTIILEPWTFRGHSHSTNNRCYTFQCFIAMVNYEAPVCH